MQWREGSTVHDQGRHRDVGTDKNRTPARPADAPARRAFIEPSHQGSRDLVHETQPESRVIDVQEQGTGGGLAVAQLLATPWASRVPDT